MAQNGKKIIHHKGRPGQISMCLSTQFRMFINRSDWKVLPMSALVAAMVVYVTGQQMGVSMEGTLKGALALACICVWNGFFNSIQVVCRERDVIKREHRNGMHVSSYVFAHMINQAFICLAEVAITIAICIFGGMKFTGAGYIFSSLFAEVCITLFLLTYASDILSLFISCIVKTSTTAMTVMPFMLIFELVFADVVFKIGSGLKFLTNLSFAKWGVRCIAALFNYNSLPMTSMWTQVQKFKDVEIGGSKVVSDAINYIEENNLVDTINQAVGQYNQNAEFASTRVNIVICWTTLAMFIVIFGILSIIALERIDRDKR